MVGFPSTLPSLDLKNLTLSDQFPPFAPPPRSKVLSRFGLGIVLSFIVLSVVLLNISFKTPLSSSVLQRFNGFASNSSKSSSFLGWPFSFSSTSGSFSALNDTASAPNGGSVVQALKPPIVVNKTIDGEPARVGANGSRNFVDSDAKGEGFEKPHLGIGSEKSKDGSFVGEGGAEVKMDGGNGSRVDENAQFRDAGGSPAVDSSHNVKNDSVLVEGSSPLKEKLNRVDVGETPRVDSLKDHISNTFLNRGDSSYKECDIFDGEWVRDDTKPYYPSGSCPYIGTDFQCLNNGRPDNSFEKWRWKPYGCNLPSFNATDFLERLRGKAVVFVGDSLNRNMWESLVCLLRHSIQDKSRVYEISGRSEFKKKGFYAFRFEDYNCSIDFVSSPFLVKESSFSGKNGSFDTLRLDLMDESTALYRDADVIVFNTGHWWTHEKTSRGENYYQEGNYVHPSLGVMEAYKKAIATWACWIDNNVDQSRTQVIFRGFSVTHFRGGPWNSGGQCHKETQPIFNKTYLVKYPPKMKVFEHVLHAMKTPVIYLNISRLTDYRKDGHPSIYRSGYRSMQPDTTSLHVQDCSHWCLPGVPDTWNELLYVSLLKSGKGSWRD